MPDYDVNVTGDPAVAVLTLTGRIDSGAMQSLTTAYDAAVADNPPVVLLDFHGVDYINSTGIALIVGLLGRARAESRRIFASGLSDHYAHIFTITRLSDFIEIFADVDSAVAGAST
jgi:anti-sigma B factor antagonist